METNQTRLDVLESNLAECRRLLTVSNREHDNFVREAGREFRSHRDRLDAIEAIHGKEYKGFNEPPHKGENMRTESEMAFGLLQEQVEELQGQVSVLESRMSVFETEPVQFQGDLHELSHPKIDEVDANDLLAWTNLLYIAKHFSLNLRRENNLWYMGIHNRKCARTWNSYDDIGEMLQVVRKEAQKHEIY